ncbi:hypothetical protein GEMRC1_003780 [Eukaryota sp. GEM-RC1]
MPNPFRSLLGIRSYYSSYYGAQGMLIPYLPVFLNSFKITGIQMSFALLLGPLMSIVTLPVGFLADKHKATHTIMLISTFGATLALATLSFAKPLIPLILCYGLYAVFNTALIPLSDSIAISEAQEKKTKYALLRSPLIFGQVLNRTDNAMLVIYCGVAGMTIASIVSLFIDQPEGYSQTRIPSVSEALQVARNPRVLTLLFSCAIHWAGTQAYILLFSIHLQDHGIGVDVASYGWGFAVAAEILILFMFSRLPKDTNWSGLIVISMLLGSLRWFITAVGTSYPWLIVVVQSFHSFTFGIFHCSSIELMEQLVPVELRSTGRTLYNGIVMGIGGVVGFLIAGWQYDLNGGRGAFLVSAVMDLIAPLVLIGFMVLNSKKRSGSETNIIPSGC